MEENLKTAIERLVPECGTRLAKFVPGILKWEQEGEIDISDPDDISRVRLILKVLDQTPGFDFFDEAFNGFGPDMVCEIIGMSPMAPSEETDIEFCYDVVPIGTYEEAQRYMEQVSWCIVISDESFASYTANGNRFYFCANRDWEDTPAVPGMGFPHDRFGYSLIAVEMTPENKIASVTSRWNTCAGDTGDFLSEEEMKTLLGDKFSQLYI